MFARCRPSGSRSPPQTNRWPSAPARAARSHSASVGSRLPAHSANAVASYQETWTTGWESFPSMELPGPSGCLQSAPGVHAHHWE